MKRFFLIITAVLVFCFGISILRAEEIKKRQSFWKDCRKPLSDVDYDNCQMDRNMNAVYIGGGIVIVLYFIGYYAEMEEQRTVEEKRDDIRNGGPVFDFKAGISYEKTPLLKFKVEW